MRIKDLAVGDKATINLLVLSSSIGSTTVKSRHLDIILSRWPDKISSRNGTGTYLANLRSAQDCSYRQCRCNRVGRK